MESCVCTEEHACPPCCERQAELTVHDLPLLRADDDLAIFAKPSGLIVHKGWGNDRTHAMKLARQRLGRKVFPIHRLDRGTSGALVFALRSEVAAKMQELFRQGSVRKRYLAIVRGIPPLEGTIDHPVPKDETGERVPAITHFRRLATSGRFALVEAYPKTGRLHQIRRHFKHLSHPLVGDVRYGSGEINRLFRSAYDLHRLALHAVEISFPHPITGVAMQAHAPVPGDLIGAFERLGFPSFAWDHSDCLIGLAG
jgi:tRNA pseudouridine65 synthase